MKQLKTLTIAFSLFIIPFSILAQTSEGIDALNAGLYSTAKMYFKKQLSDSISKPEASYYLGELYNLTGQKDSAAYYYTMGIECIGSNALCLVGKAGLVMEKEPAVALELIKKAKSLKGYKKNPALNVALAKIYSQNNQNDLAFETLDLAKELNKKYTNIYIAEGDILFKQNKVGEAATKYETAIYYDANCKVAYQKVATIYFLAKNFEQSLSYLEKLKAIDPNYPPALKLFGDIHYEKGRYAEAVPFYEAYLHTPDAGINDQIRYAYALFFNKEYEKSNNEIRQLIPKDPNNQVLKRILAYISYETGNYADGLTQMKDFWAIVDTVAVISFDYKYYARLLAKNNQDSLSIPNYQKAIETSEKPQELYKEVALLYEKMKNYFEAANYMEKHLNSNSNVPNSDFYLLGKDLYIAAGTIDSVAIAQDSTKAVFQKNLYHKADSIFALVVEKAPTNHLGYLWRARVNSLLDPETDLGLAKPYYEKVIEILEQPGKNNKKELIEAYQYFGYYNYVKKEKAEAKNYWAKILALDPNHAVAKQAMESKE
jgi:tetratricopeptide (TPR) repeat protein